MRFLFRALCTLTCLFPAILPAQNLISNPSFESGSGSPTGWVFNDGTRCVWEPFGRTGTRSVSLTNYNPNCNGMQWRSAPFAVQPGAAYLVDFHAVSSNAWEVARVQVGIGTTGNSGLCDRYVFPPGNWARFPSVTIAPRNQTSLILRMISCQGVGTVGFDDVAVMPIAPAHSLESGNTVGFGESVSPGKYHFTSSLRDLGVGYYYGNYSRAAYDCTAFFSTFFNYTLANGAHIAYRHDCGGKLITNATANVVTYPSGLGNLVTEFSVDATNWVNGFTYNVTNFSSYATTTNVVPVPPSLLPATNIFVRVRAASGTFYVTRYYFDADVPANGATSEGKSLLFAQRVATQNVELIGTSNAVSQLVLKVANTNGAARNFALRWNVAGPSGTRYWGQTNNLPAGSTNQFTLDFAGMGWGENSMTLEVVDLVSGSTNFAGSAIFWEWLIRDSSFGAMLPGNALASLWWCQGAYNVGRDRALPVASNTVISITAARNDYEPFQLVLKPSVNLSNAVASITDFVGLGVTNAFTISSTNVELCLVDYVPIITPTDDTCIAGDHPDPLLPWTSATTLFANTNQPVWGTVHVPRNAPAGEYQATLTIQTSAGNLQATVNLRVYGFTLPDNPQTQMSNDVKVDDYWHASTNSSLVPQIYEIYLENFRKHRVSPYLPHNYSKFNYVQQSDTNGISYKFDFVNFDRAIEKYMGEFGFNHMRLVAGDVVPTQLNGNARWTPAYNELYKKFMQPVMAHLREKALLKKTYCYWIDEPSAEIVASTVVPGMRSMGEAAPGLNRFLTREPIPELIGLIDTWVPWTPWLIMSTMPIRQAAGEQFWWYVSGGPGYPYAMYFTDYPATSPRLRQWQTEKFGFAGEDGWDTTWWIGTLHAPINPWTNTMCRLFDGSAHGNGNGALLYPPTKTPPSSILVAPPINSIRWENIREGVEDREFFWLLARAVERREPVLGSGHPAIVQAKAARESALGNILSRTYFDHNALPIYSGRATVAEAIEALGDNAPLFARHPDSQAGIAGSNVTLRAEAIGWPQPAYQWLQSGTNVPGATNANHVLVGFTNSHLGTWQCVASNSSGVTLSTVAKLAGYWVAAPQIIDVDAGDYRRVGDRTVLEVTAVSALPMTYRWYLNGVLLSGITNNAWAITNLSIASAGIYTVTASNAAGIASSGPITLSILPSYSNQPPTFTANWAGNTNGFQLQLPVDNRTRSVLVSTNLSNWTTQFIVAPTGLPQTITDSTATNLPHKFYRMKAE